MRCNRIPGRSVSRRSRHVSRLVATLSARLSATGTANGFRQQDFHNAWHVSIRIVPQLVASLTKYGNQPLGASRGRRYEEAIATASERGVDLPMLDKE